MPAVAQFYRVVALGTDLFFRLKKAFAPGERYLAFDTTARWLVCPVAEACRRIYRRSIPRGKVSWQDWRRSQGLADIILYASSNRRSAFLPIATK
jgi:hypothetical protein